MLNKTFDALVRRTTVGIAGVGESIDQIQQLSTCARQHGSTIASQHGPRTEATLESLARLQSEFANAGWAGLVESGQAYLVDAWQRGVLTADVLRERGNIFEAHEAAGAPPVLCYEYDIVVDGHDLTRPVDALLLENWRRTGAGVPQLAIGAD